jgi:PAS domain S-box-containing protein
MTKKPSRGSIERRFVVSILWVGVIPMVLAMIIGYLAARETQQKANLQDLSTAARKTADAIRLALEERELQTVRVTQFPEVIAYLTQRQANADTSTGPLMTTLRRESRASGERQSVYTLYDPAGTLLLGTNPADPFTPATLQDASEINGPKFIDFRYIPTEGRYAAVLVAPVKTESGETVGFITETQGVRDLLVFILGDRRTDRKFPASNDFYEIIIYSDLAKWAVYPDESSSQELPPPHYAPIDLKIVSRLQRYPDRESDALFIWNYLSRGQRTPVLIAYHRLMPDSSIYIAVHRRTPQVFSKINLAALLTLGISGIIIAVFCVIAYRNVNNTIIRPLALLNEGAQIIRQGDLDLKLRIGTGDEIEELAASFNEMAAALRSNLKQLRNSEEKHRSLVTSMRDGLFQTDGNGLITFINPSGGEILGHADFSAVLGRSMPDLFLHRGDYEHITLGTPDNPIIEGTRVWLLRPDGTAICVDLSGNRLYDDKGRLSGIDGTFRDVTRGVRLEQEAAERAERISVINQIANVVNSSLEAGRVYENIGVELRKLIAFDYAAVSLWLEGVEHFETRQLWPEPREGREQFPRLDGSGSCAAWVAAEQRCLLVEDLGAANSLFSFQFPERVRGILCVPLYASARIIGTLNLGAEQTGFFTQHDAEVLEQLAPHLAAALRNAQLLDNLKLSLEEVTRAREKLHAANEELKSLDEMKTNLLSNVSHELRTPLVAVMGYTDMVINGKAGPVTEKQRNYLGISLRNVEKLVTLIENLLDFSRLYRGAEELVFTRFDLLDCVRMSVESVKPVADSKGIALTTTARNERGEPYDPPVLVEGDKGKLGQVFNNLLSNAVKFNEPGGSVAVAVDVRNNIAHISVTDTGIGIPEGELDKVFSRFYQVDSSSTRKYGGTGIGLAIAQDIVRLHGSRISVSSRLGEGATFQFNLSLSGAARQVPGDEIDFPPPIETHLLVEVVTQDRSLATQLRNLLLADGMDIIHAASATTAIGLAAHHNPDCIVLDTEAGPLGSLVVEEIVDAPGLSAPVVLLTNDDELYERFQSRLAGRIRRNFRKSTLLSGLHSAMNRNLPSGRQLGNRVLCVDDDPEIGQFIVRCLENDGFEASLCDRGEAALELAATGDYWMGLLDIAMPGIDGWETCRRLKTDPDLAGFRVHIVTAKPIDTLSAEFRNSGADGYLLKPFKGEDLIAVVRAFDAQRRRA